MIDKVHSPVDAEGHAEVGFLPPDALDPVTSSVPKAARGDPAEADKLNLGFDAIKWGLVDKARAIFESMKPSAARANGLNFLDRLDIGEALLARVTERNADTAIHEEASGERRLRGILVAPWAEGSSRALIVFGGNADKIFPIAKPLFKDPSHLFVIRDPSRCFGMCELPRLGPDYDTNLALLRRMLQELGAHEVYCIGFSSGGFPALKYGLDLQGSGVLAFSCPTSLDIADDPGSDLSKYPQLALLYRKARHRATSMAVEYTASLRRPRVLLVFGKDHPRDTFCANLMAGVPGIRLKALGGFQGHGSFAESVSRGAFTGFLDQLFELKPFVRRLRPNRSRAREASSSK